MGSFLANDARGRLLEVVREIEENTAAEVVVAVRARSSAYRHVDYLGGAALSFAMLLVFLFSPVAYSIDTMPIAWVASFALGAFGVAHLPWIKRAVMCSSELDAQVLRAARSAFIELRVSRKHRRSGMLVFVSVFERRVQVVADIGVPSISPKMVACVRELETSLLCGGGLAEFTEKLRRLGPVCAELLPRGVGDTNELEDEVLG